MRPAQILSAAAPASAGTSACGSQITQSGLCANSQSTLPNPNVPLVCLSVPEQPETTFNLPLFNCSYENDSNTNETKRACDETDCHQTGIASALGAAALTAGAFAAKNKMDDAGFSPIDKLAAAQGVAYDYTASTANSAWTGLAGIMTGMRDTAYSGLSTASAGLSACGSAITGLGASAWNGVAGTLDGVRSAAYARAASTANEWADYGKEQAWTAASTWASDNKGKIALGSLAAAGIWAGATYGVAHVHGLWCDHGTKVTSVYDRSAGVTSI